MDTNVKPKTIFTGDNLPIMQGMNSESVDLIYLDPPFNSNANYAAPIGSEAAGMEKWEKAKVDIITSENMGVDIVTRFYSDEKNIETFGARMEVPEDIAGLLGLRDTEEE